MREMRTTGRIVFVLVCVLLAGCSKRIDYAPAEPSLTVPQAIRVVQRTIEQQPRNHVPLAVAVTPVKLAITTHFESEEDERSGSKVLYFEDLTSASLHSRRGYFVVTFRDSKRHQFRIYVAYRPDAERFIDSLYVVSKEAKFLETLPDAQRVERIRSVMRMTDSEFNSSPLESR